MLITLRIAVLLFVLAGTAGAILPDVAAALLPEQPGWTAEPSGGTRNNEGTLALRIYHRGDARAVLVLVAGNLADGVANGISTMRPEQFVPPFPQAADRWAERGHRFWVTERDGLLYEAGMVLTYQAGHPGRSTYASVTGTNLTRADGLAMLHSLDWDRIASLATQ